LPLVIAAFPTTVLLPVSTNCTVPVGVVLPGTDDVTAAVRVAWTPDSDTDTAVAVGTSVTVTAVDAPAGDHVPSPPYWAEMVSVPTGRELTEIDAVPPVTAALPRFTAGPNGFAPGIENDTVPVGAANPVGTVAASLAVSVTACPNTGLAGEAVTLNVTTAFTVCPKAAVAAGHVKSPLY
jgi:hypothetical protein